MSRRVTPGRLFSPARGRWAAALLAVSLTTTFTLPAAGVGTVAAPSASAQATTADKWVGSWSATPLPAPGPDNTLGMPLTYVNQTLRQIIRPNFSGDTARIRLSNRYGTTPITFTDARIAKQVPGTGELPVGLGTPLVPISTDDFPGQLVSPATLSAAVQGAAFVVGSSRRLMFGGSSSVTIAPGQDRWSDPLPFPVRALENLMVSFYLPTLTGESTQHTIGNQVNYVAPGNVTDVNPLPLTSLPFAPNGISYYFLSGLDVLVRPSARTVVALGDSITDGLMSMINANNRYPDYLAERLRANSTYRDVSVLNEGVAGQRFLFDNIGPSTLKSLELNVLSRSDVKYLIVEAGINDLANPPFLGIPGRHPEPICAQQVIDGMRQLIDRAHARGIKVYATTITPSGNLANPARGVFPTYSLPEVIAKRHAVNNWIRTGGAADAVIDFDAVIRDPLNPDALKPAYTSADNLHPNDAGYKLLADSINLALFN